MQYIETWADSADVLKTGIGASTFGMHDYRASTDIIKIHPEQKPYWALSTFIHEVIHSRQHSFTALGVFTLGNELKLFEMLLADIKRQRLKITPDRAFPKIQLSNQYRLNTALTHLMYGTNTNIIDFQTNVAQLPQLLENSSIKIAVNTGLKQKFSVGGAEFDPTYTSPYHPTLGVIAGQALLETSALAAQIAGVRALPTYIGSHSSIYCGAQLLFLRVLHPWMSSVIPESSEFPPNVPPLKHLLQLFCGVDLSQDISSSMADSIDSNSGKVGIIISICLLFCVLVNKSLAIPLASRSSPWHDLHPGWRFVRILSVFEGTLKGGGVKLEDALKRPSEFFQQCGEAIGFPTTEQFIHDLAEWSGDSCLVKLRWSLDRLGNRLIKCGRGSVQSVPWIFQCKVLGIDLFDWLSRDNIVRKDLDERESMNSSHANQLAKFDASYTFCIETGDSLWGNPPESQDESLGIRSDSDCRGFIEGRRRKLLLSDAITTEFFHLLLNRLAMSPTEDPLHVQFRKLISCGNNTRYIEIEESVREMIGELAEMCDCF